MTIVAGNLSADDMPYPKQGTPALSAFLFQDSFFASSSGDAIGSLVISPSSGDLYFVDNYYNVIYVVYAMNNTLYTYAGTASFCAIYAEFWCFLVDSGDGGLATNATIYRPTHIALSAVGDMYIASLRKVRIVWAGNRTIDTYAGDNTESCLSSDNVYAPYACIYPTAVAVEPLTADVYIASQDRIAVVSAETKILHYLSGATLTGTFCGDGGMLSQACFYTISDLQFDAFRNLLVADRGNGRVRALMAGNGVACPAGYQCRCVLA